MIKAAVLAIPIIVALNLVVAIGFVGWLHQSGRLNSERVQRAVDMFKPTIAQEEKLKKEAEAQAVIDAETAKVQARLAHIEAGGETLSQMFERGRTQEESSQQVVSRMTQEAQQLRTQMRNFQAILDKQQADLNAAREAFAKQVQQQKDRVKDEDFLQTVKLMETLEPKAVKGVFDNLIQQGDVEEVVEYLAAMNPRKSAGVLTEYKGPENAPTLTDLLVRLDHRRTAPLDALAATSASSGSTSGTDEGSTP